MSSLPPPDNEEDPQWMQDEDPSPVRKVFVFLESRVNVALVAGLLAAVAVYLMSPPMIHGDDGKPEFPKALFWGAVAAGIALGLPMLLSRAEKKEE